MLSLEVPIHAVYYENLRLMSSTRGLFAVKISISNKTSSKESVQQTSFLSDARKLDFVCL